jgi:NADH-quinone oxidoreductase subunit C
VTATPTTDQHPVVQQIRAWDPAAIMDAVEFRGELTLVVARENLLRVAEFLRNTPGLEFNFLSDIATVDRFPIEPRFELNYELLSIPNRQSVRLRVRVPENTAPVMDTITPVWPTANWQEREIFDLFGIRFEGHGDLRRILMPDDWEGYPLRKDYPVEGYR